MATPQEYSDSIVDDLNFSPNEKAFLDACIKDDENKIPGRDLVRNALLKLTEDPAPAHKERLRSILDDMTTLPLKKGDAYPAPEQLKDVEDTLENNQALFEDIAEKLEGAIQASGKATFTEIYNEIQVTNDRNKPIIWESLSKNPEVAAMLKRVSAILAQSIVDPDAENIAWSEIEKLMINSPIQHINAKTPALILLKKVKDELARAMIRKITNKVQHGEMALLPGGEKVEQPKAWTDSMDAAMNFLKMEDVRYVDMLSTSLGQAQTADPTKAEPYFRKRETAEGAPHNNFSYVYVTKSEWQKIAPKSQSRSFMYMGEDYCAIPIGEYYEHRTPDPYWKSMASIENLMEHYQGTPAGIYYEKLLSYMTFAQRHQDLEGDALTKGYFDACYEAERAWVAYVKYAETENLPFIHVHPFEKYRTVSTKEHEFSVAILEPRETAVYMEGKRKFTDNAKAFLDREGIAAQWPEMAEESLRVIKSAGCVSLGARIGSVSGAVLAESIPEELAGKRDGIIVLFDTQFAQGRLRSAYGNLLKSNDILGDLADQYMADIQNLEKFMLHYIISVLAHELNHNLYMGSKTSFQGDGRGLAIGLVEEVKATHGLALSFNDPYNLTPEDLGQLREVLLLILPWHIFRLRRIMRAQHTSHQYLREGTVMLDHGIKSGVLEVVGVKVEPGQENDENGMRLKEVTPDQGDATIIRFNFGDQQLQDYISRTADFLKGLATPYHQTQHIGSLPDGTVVPDITNVEAWQSASFLCYQEQISNLRAQGETGDISRLERERDALEKTWSPEMEATIRALIDFVDGKEAGKLNTAVRQAMSVKSPEVQVSDEQVKAEVERLEMVVKNSRPQIHSNGEIL